MGPLLSLFLIAIGSAAVFGAMFLVLRMFLRTTDALRYAGGFVVGMGAGAALSVGLLALVIGTGATFTTKTQVWAYLATVAFSVLTGGAALSHFSARNFR